MTLPVPAGISRPTITFSFSPCRLSIRPETAASVRTRVVSWNEAAEMNEFVCRLALVMPCNPGLAVAEGSPRRPQPLRFDLDGLALELEPVGLLAGQECRVARIVDLDLLQHLTNDHLD